MQCFKCQGYGHMANECKNEAKCRVCGQNHNSRDCTENTPKCVNCQGQHRSDDKSCPKMVEKQNILKKVTKEKISIKEARKEVINQNKKKETNIQEKGKKPKVTKDILTDLEGVDNLLVFIGLVITNLKSLSV